MRPRVVAAPKKTVLVAMQVPGFFGAPGGIARGGRRSSSASLRTAAALRAAASNPAQRRVVEPPATWFEEAYSKQRKCIENKAFFHFCCATKPPVTPG
jgi:hypothetical protein